MASSDDYKTGGGGIPAGGFQGDSYEVERGEAVSSNSQATQSLRNVDSEKRTAGVVPTTFDTNERNANKASGSNWAGGFDQKLGTKRTTDSSTGPVHPAS